MSSSYRPPTDSYDFLVREVIDVGEVLTRSESGMTVDDIAVTIREAGRIATEVLDPLNGPGDRQGLSIADGEVSLPDGYADAFSTLAEGGWLGFSQPSEYGGGDAPDVVRHAVDELWAASNLSMSLGPLLTGGAIHAIAEIASPEIRSTYLPPMIAGEWTGTMNLTEPQAGTDLGRIRTTAAPAGDDTWRIQGEKIFISWGEHDASENIIHLVLARTEGAPDGMRGLSLFLVPKYLLGADGGIGTRNTVSCVSIEEKLGIHACPTCVMAFDGATGYLVGKLGEGLSAMFVMMNKARIGVGVQALGIADRATQHAQAYAAERIQGRVVGIAGEAPIADHPDVRRLLSGMSSSVTAMRAMSLQLAVWSDLAELAPEPHRAEAAQRRDFFVPIFKAWCTEHAQTVVSDGLQVHGGMGFIEETGAAQYLRDARILPIYEGTTAIQANDLIGRKLIRDDGAVALDVLASVREDLNRLESAARPAPTLLRVLRDAVGAVDRCTQMILERGADSRDNLASAVPYTMLWGAVAGAWMHARIALAATGDAQLDAGVSAEAFAIGVLAPALGNEVAVVVGEAGAPTVSVRS